MRSCLAGREAKGQFSKIGCAVVGPLRVISFASARATVDVNRGVNISICIEGWKSIQEMNRWGKRYRGGGCGLWGRARSIARYGREVGRVEAGCVAVSIALFSCPQMDAYER